MIGISAMGNSQKVGRHVDVYDLVDESAKFKLKPFGHWLLALIPITIGFSAAGETLSRMVEFI